MPAGPCRRSRLLVFSCNMCKGSWSTVMLSFFLFSFTSLSNFFTHIETNQSVGGAKTGVPGEKPPDTPASRTWLVSHVNSCPVRGANPHQWDDRMIKSTEVSDLNHSATGAALMLSFVQQYLALSRQRLVGQRTTALRKHAHAIYINF